MWGKTYLLVLCLTGFCYGWKDSGPTPHHQINFSDPHGEFNKFIVKHGKQYKNYAEKQARFENFQKTLQQIQTDQANARGNVVFGIGPMSDWTDDEKNSIFSRVPHKRSTLPKLNTSHLRSKRQTLPTNFDWRDQNGVSSVKNQGQCGSCWAHCSVAVLESMYLIYKNESYDLSEQEIVDCVNKATNPVYYSDAGCNGGWPIDALDYTVNYQISTEAAYPYVGVEGPCNPPTTGKLPMTQWYAIEPLDEDLSAQVVFNHGPVTHSIDVPTSFNNYVSGVFWPTDAECLQAAEENRGHGIEIVGFGVENGIPYWLCKNSWGPYWGMDGFFKLARGNLTCSMLEYMVTASFDPPPTQGPFPTYATAVPMNISLTQPCNTAQFGVDPLDVTFNVSSPCRQYACPEYQGFGLYSNKPQLPLKTFGYMTFWTSVPSNNVSVSTAESRYPFIFSNCTNFCLIEENGHFWVNSNPSDGPLGYFLPYCDPVCHMYLIPDISNNLTNLNTSEIYRGAYLAIRNITDIFALNHFNLGSSSPFLKAFAASCTTGCQNLIYPASYKEYYSQCDIPTTASTTPEITTPVSTTTTTTPIPSTTIISNDTCSCVCTTTKPTTSTTTPTTTTTKPSTTTSTTTTAPNTTTSSTSTTTTTTPTTTKSTTTTTTPTTTTTEANPTNAPSSALTATTTTTPPSQFCCSNRDALLNPSAPNSSTLVQSFYTAYSTKGTNQSYPFKWGPTIWTQWAAILNTNITTLIGDSGLTNAQKHEQIYNISVNFINDKLAANKSYTLCVPENGFGYFGDYLQCQVYAGSPAPSYSLKCSDWFLGCACTFSSWALPSYPCTTLTLAP